MDDVNAAKKLFSDLKAWFTEGELRKIGVVKIRFLEPALGIQTWKPSDHASLEGYMTTIPGLINYHKSQIRAEYDFENETCRIVNKQSWTAFLKILERERGELRVSMPRKGALARGLQAAGFIANEAADKVIKWCQKKFASSGITQEKVDEEMKALKSTNLDVKADTAQQTGDIKEFKDVEGDKMEELTKSLTSDGVPASLTNAIKRATLMKKNSEAVFDLQYKNGKLEHAFMMQIITMRKQSGLYDILLAHFQISVSQGNEQETFRTITLDQMAALQKYIEASAGLFWKKKADELLANSSEGEADEFLVE